MTADEALNQIACLLAPQPLNKVQKLILRHSWEGLSYGDIARQSDYDIGYIRDTGSKLWQLLSQIIGEKVTKHNLSAVILHHLPKNTLSIPIFNSSQDWGEIVDTAVFYGREEEINTLKQWVVADNCRFITILGQGGAGKTTLTAKLARQLASNFNYTLWRSLQTAPHLDELLTHILQFLSKDNTPLPEKEHQKLAKLQQHLQSDRCLIILDNYDALFSPNQPCGVYRQGYENYQQLTQLLAKTAHQSCILVTSREPISEIRSLPTKEWQLQGLDSKAAQNLLNAKGIEGTKKEIERLIATYQGYPLALNIVASSIQSLFLGKLNDFWQQGAIAWGNIRQMLKSQIARLSTAEEQIIYWLMIEGESTRINTLQANIFPTLPPSDILEAVESLKGRSLIEVTQEGFTLQPVIKEFLIEQFIAKIIKEIPNQAEPNFFCRFALIKATTKDYIRESQTRLLLEPIVQDAIAVLGNSQAVIEHLQTWLKEFKKGNIKGLGYAIANLIHLLIHLKVDLTGYDFSGLPIWQAYLAQVSLQGVNFANAELRDCVFAETFGGISDVAFNREGNLLATSDTSGEVHLWQISNGKPLLSFKADRVWTWVVIFSPDGEYLATAGDDYIVKLWEVNTGKCLQELEGHTNTVNDLAFHPQGHFLASCALDHTIRVWDLRNLAKESKSTVLAGHSQRVWSVAFSPDGLHLVSASEDKTIQLWNLRTGNREQIFENYPSWVKTVDFSPDGQTIASGCFDGTIELRHRENSYRWQGHSTTVTKVHFSPDGRLLASCSYDQTVKLWDIVSKKCIKRFIGHQNRVWSVKFSPDGQFLASGGDDNTTQLWQIASGQRAKAWKGYSNSILCLEINENAGLMATGHEDQTVKLWDIETGKERKVLYGHNNRVWAVAFDLIRPIMASGSADRSIKLWNWQTGKCMQTLDEHSSWIWSIAFEPQGNLLASGSYDRTIKLWDRERGDCVKTLVGHTDSVRYVVFSADSQYLYSCSFDKTIKIWDYGIGECVQTLTGHQNTVWMLALSENGRFLASASYDQTLKLWNRETGRCLQTFIGHQAAVYSVIFTKDDKYLISGSFDRSIKVWDVNTGECLQTLIEHQGTVSALRFYQENLVSSSFDETIRFWQLRTGKCTRIQQIYRPYENMNITGIQGVSEFQQARLKALGAK